MLHVGCYLSQNKIGEGILNKELI